MNFHQTKKYHNLSLKQITKITINGHSQHALIHSKTYQKNTKLQCSLLTSSMFYDTGYKRIKEQISKIQKQQIQQQQPSNKNKIEILKKNKDQLSSWLIVCLYKLNRVQQYNVEFQKINTQKQIQIKKYLFSGDKNKFQISLQNVEISRLFSNQGKIRLRESYQMLLQKANFENYFKQQNVPVYLLNMKWITDFYDFVLEKQQKKQKKQKMSQDNGYDLQQNQQKKTINLNISSFPIKPVDNRYITQTMTYIDTDPKYHHYNYQIKHQYKQNYDYKLISYQAWKFISQRFGGIQLKRFTTPQKHPSVQVYYRKINILITQQQYILINDMEILVSRFQSINNVIARLKRLLIQYQIVQFEDINSIWESYIVKMENVENQEKESKNQRQSKVPENTLIDAIQNSSQTSPLDQNFDGQINKIPNLSYTIDECQIYQMKNTILVFNILGGTIDDVKNNSQKLLYKKQNSIFKEIQELQSNDDKPKCLSCGSPEDLNLCTCGSVYFCSKSCKTANKQHIKICKSIMKEKDEINQLISKYKATKRVYDIKSNQFIVSSGKVGLQNLGNTCYMNAALQCILRVEQISKLFLKNQHIKDINISNVLGSQGHLAFAYGQFVKDYYTTNKRALQPTTILKIIAKNPQFRGHNHQDSQQFLNYFLDKLHEDLNRIKKKPYIQDIQSNGRPDQKVSQQSWQNYLKRNQSYISQNLTGQYRSQIRCPDCQKISITFDPFMSVTLPFPKQQKKVQIQGYFLTYDGQFQKVQQNVKASMNSKQFCEKIFHFSVVPIHIQNKKICLTWNMQLSVNKNYKQKGILIFCQKPQTQTQNDKLICIDLQIVKGKEFESLNRRIYFVNQIQSQKQLKKSIFRIIKKPLIKSIKASKKIEAALKELYQDYDQDENDSQQYFKMCEKLDFIQFQEDLPFEFPLKVTEEDKTISPSYQLGAQVKKSFIIRLSLKRKISIKIQGQQKQIQLSLPQNIKFNVSSGQYQYKQKLKSRSLKDPLTIHSLIQSFNQPQQLTQDNTWYCSQCKQHKQALKIMSIYKLPKYLIIHFKRFNHRGNRYVIYGQKVQTPVILENYQQINGFKYQLIGVVNHFGSLSFGHYTAYVKKQKNQWYYYDDQSVKRRRMDGDNAYLAVYKQIQKQQQ